MPKKKTNGTKERVAELAQKTGVAPMPKAVLRLTDYLYITCDKHCWKVVEVNDTYNPTTGEKYPDKPILFSSSLQGILKVAARYMIRVPADVAELSKKIDNVYSLIEARIPVDVKPRELFEFEFGE